MEKQTCQLKRREINDFELELVSVKKLYRAQLPISSPLDLGKAFNSLKDIAQVRYDPESNGFPCMYVLFGEVGFAVFRNGKVMVYGKKDSLKKVSSAVHLFFEQYLDHFF